MRNVAVVTPRNDKHVIVFDLYDDGEAICNLFRIIFGSDVLMQIFEYNDGHVNTFAPGIYTMSEWVMGLQRFMDGCISINSISRRSQPKGE